MVANTALMAILGGASLILVAPATLSVRRSAAGRLCAGAVVVIAIMTLAEHVFGVDLRIDRALVSPPALPSQRSPGRASLQTAAAFAIIGAALLSINWRTQRGRHPAALLALVAGLIAVLALLGYLFGAAALYSAAMLYPYVGMAIPTAVAVATLGLGVMAARADEGMLSPLMVEDSGGMAARQLVAYLLVFAAVILVIEIGARAGLYDTPIAYAVIVLLGIVGGSWFVLRLSRRLSRLDARRAANRERLRESQERFELALRGASLAAWDWHVKSGEVVYNARWAEMRGYRPDEIQPHVSMRISGVHPDDRSAVEKALADHFGGRAPEYVSEHRVRTKSGDWIWILDRGRVFERDDQGQPVRMVGTELDITARKTLETALGLAEARSSGILSVSADAIISIDEEQRITSFNTGAEKMFGYAKDEVMGAPIDTLTPERFRSAYREHIGQFASGGEAAQHMGEQGIELYGLRKSSEEFPADATISKLDVDGSRILTVALRDITDQQRRESEKALLAQAGAILTSSLDYEKTLPKVDRLATVEFADLALVDVVDGDDVRRLDVVSRDPAHAWICDMLMDLDRTRPDLIRSVLQTKHRSVVERVGPHALAPLAQDVVERRIFSAIGLASVIAVPLLAHDKTLGAMGFVRTAKSKAYDAAHVRLAEQLAERVALAIENGLLYRSAQQAIQARDDVMGVVAHDLRNPLGTILMQASLLRSVDAQEDGRCDKAMMLIERAAKRMNRLIHDLLDVSRIDAGSLVLDRERVRTRGLLVESVDAHISLAAAGGLVVRLRMTPKVPDAQGDRHRLLQVFENLIGNAIKFTDHGGRITVGAKPCDGQVLFWVSDTGHGIEPGDMPRLFDRFWQAEEARHKGAGLGLPIVKGIVEAHGGRIWAESVPMRGTTFYFTIPAAARMQELHDGEPVTVETLRLADSP
jgi:PAS domain S-box-containing protein